MPTTWDPAHKDSLQTLSNGNKTATSSAGSGTINSGVYATQAISATIKQYFEVTLNAIGPNAQYLSIGVMNGSASLAANIGATNGAAISSYLSGGNTKTYINGVIGTTAYPNFAAGQVIRIAVDRAANKIWWAVNNNPWFAGATPWMGSGGTTDDPASGVGGASISGVTGTIYPALSSAFTGDVDTLNAGATAFAYAVPSGFVGVDSTAAAAQAVRAMVLA